MQRIETELQAKLKEVGQLQQQLLHARYRAISGDTTGCSDGDGNNSVSVPAALSSKLATDRVARKAALESDRREALALG